ncbi:uncharacterized protein LOC112511565 [Cynara cardunculus var. scolymus]|uniref:Small ribosomal subunit protein mS38 n=1 Tax=Cynara cardunculus var. scolymus TaxID=59895 RepID=A0A103YHF5_CYNCS|nr:uncharacterized protein LOC112511565 [Cynara cardunculus var. scolymus]KVI09159.1 protein of unknown function DUF1713, mitochondria [Cynara cardunculus var. scolymus]
MASLLLRLVRKQSPSTTLVANLNKRILSPSTHLPDSKPVQPATAIPFFNGVPETTDELNPHHHSSCFYPTFAFESFLNPVSQIGFIQSAVPEEEEEDIVSGNDEQGIWADSVKKKRKKKMNKHKLKKLRKRLRRKT